MSLWLLQQPHPFNVHNCTYNPLSDGPHHAQTSRPPPPPKKKAFTRFGLFVKFQNSLGLFYQNPAFSVLLPPPTKNNNPGFRYFVKFLTSLPMPHFGTTVSNALTVPLSNNKLTTET